MPPTDQQLREACMVFSRHARHSIYYDQVADRAAMSTEELNRMLLALQIMMDGKTTGASGSFTTADGKTVTVLNGIISRIQ